MRVTERGRALVESTEPPCRRWELAYSIYQRRLVTCGWPRLYGERSCLSRHGSLFRWARYELNTLRLRWIWQGRNRT